MYKNLEINCMVACGENDEIGAENELLWKLKGDLQLFKNMTKGHDIIVGRKTFESFGKPLPKRTNIVITRDENYAADGCIIVHSLEEAFERTEDESPFVIGGEEIYREALLYVDNLYLTRVHSTFDNADTFFPEIDFDNWKVKKELYNEADPNNEYDFTFYELERKQNE